MDCHREYKRWMDCKDLTPDEYSSLKEYDGEKIRQFFSESLEFGTAGLRGIMCPGTAAMNYRTVIRATRGLCRYLKDKMSENSVCIAYDTRNMSREFAECAATVCASEGIRAYIFDSPRPTPEMSFSIRYLGCTAGINITASHNPKEYNGYKAYSSNGAQLSPEDAAEVAGYIDNIDVLEKAPNMKFSDGVERGIIEVIGNSVDEAYISKVLEQRTDKVDNDISVLYTPLFGSGWRLVPEVLKRAGFKDVRVLSEQAEPNGNFPGLDSPNPESKKAFSKAFEYAEKDKIDIIIATDPDADRVGAAVLHNGSYRMLSGNEIGVLLVHHVIESYGKNLPKNAYVIKSIVSTPLADKICEYYGVKLCNVLTGFRFIGELIEKNENAGNEGFIFGFEESYGYLKGTYARDKDGVVSSMLICEAAASYAKKGMTLVDALSEIWKKFGFYKEHTESIVFSGADAGMLREKATSFLRNSPPENIGEYRVVSMLDFKERKKTGKNTSIAINDFPVSDVIYIETTGGTVIVRPSGTEPKVKVYYLTVGEDETSAEEKYLSLKKEMEEIMRSI